MSPHHSRWAITGVRESACSAPSSSTSTPNSPGVDRPDLYDPQLNRSFGELAEHYGVLVDPARSRNPLVEDFCAQAGLPTEAHALTAFYRARLPGFTTLDKMVAAIRIAFAGALSRSNSLRREVGSTGPHQLLKRHVDQIGGIVLGDRPADPSSAPDARTCAVSRPAPSRTPTPRGAAR